MSFLRHIQPKARFVLIGLGATLAMLGMSSSVNALIGRPGTPSAIGLLFNRQHFVGAVDLSFLQDPVALMITAACFATPVFCLEQVAAISDFVGMNEVNIAYRAAHLQVDDINRAIALANRRFRAIGSYPVSIVLFAVCGLSAHYLYDTLAKRGLLASWNPTELSNQQWRTMVYAGWWANRTTHPVLYLFLWLAGTYLFYFVAKQLAMGLAFADFARSTMALQFGVAPNLIYNSDGYWGLRSLRRFMQWTYGSALIHFTVTLCTFIVWLPFNQTTVFLVTGVVLANVAVVIYPSSIAYHSAVREKQRYLDHALTITPDTSAVEKLADKIWERPNLPFRARSTFSAVAIYLLAPIILAIVSSLIS